MTTWWHRPPLYTSTPMDRGTPLLQWLVYRICPVIIVGLNASVTSRGRAQHMGFLLLRECFQHLATKAGAFCWLLALAPWIFPAWWQLCRMGRKVVPLSLPIIPSAFYRTSLYSYWLMAGELCCNMVTRSWNHLSRRRHAFCLLEGAPTSEQLCSQSFPSPLLLSNFKWNQCCLCVVPTEWKPIWVCAALSLQVPQGAARRI